MKYLILSMLIVCCSISCSKSCSDKAEENFEIWQSIKPTNYAYTIQRSAYLPLEYLGPYRIEIRDNVMDTAYFDLNFFQGEIDHLFEGWDNFEIILPYLENSGIEEVFELAIGSDSDCSILFDPIYYFPSEYNIIPDPEIADSGFSLQIRKFELLE